MVDNKEGIDMTHTTENGFKMSMVLAEEGEAEDKTAKHMKVIYPMPNVMTVVLYSNRKKRLSFRFFGDL